MSAVFMHDFGFRNSQNLKDVRLILPLSIQGLCIVENAIIIDREGK